MKIASIIKETIPAEGRVHHKRFWELLAGTPENKHFLKLQKQNPDLNVRGLAYLDQHLNGVRAVCRGCGKQTVWVQRAPYGFSTFCSSQCSNRDAGKKSITSAALSARCADEAMIVAKVLKKYKGTEITKLSAAQVKKFNRIVEVHEGQPREYDLMKAMTPDLRTLWVNLPATNARGRLLMATGQQPLIVYCEHCRGRIKKMPFYGWGKYCSSKCSGIATVPLRITPESSAKAGATYKLKLASIDPTTGCTYQSAMRGRLKKAFTAKYGVSNPSQVPSIRRKQLVSGLRTKQVALGARTVHVQGYEEFGIDWLLSKGCKPSQIKVESEGKVPVIHYRHAGKDRVYYPDIFVPSRNLIVEVKSVGTLLRNEACWKSNRAKVKALQQSQYKWMFLVIRPDGSRIDMPKDWWSFSFARLRRWIKSHASS